MLFRDKGTRKKIFCVLISAVVILGMLPSQFAMSIEGTVNMTIGNIKGVPGSEIDVPINFSDVTSITSINNCDFAILYDKANLTLVSAASGSIVKDPTINFDYHNLVDDTGASIGQINFFYNDDSVNNDRYISENGIFAIMKFKINNSAQIGTNFPITIKSIGAFSKPDTGLTNINVNPVGGNIGVAAMLQANVGSISGQTGSDIVVPINLTNTLASGINKCEFTVKFDSAKLTYISAEAGDAVDHTACFSASNTVAGEIKLTYSDVSETKSQPITKTGKLANLTFRINGNAVEGNSSITIINPINLLDGNAQEFLLDVSTGTGTITIRTVDECFIATAAYGSKFMPAVTLLRSFRDDFLLTNTAGQAFVKFYYKNSPPIANFIAGNNSLRVFVRVLLTPLVLVVYSLYHPMMLILISIILMMAVGKKRNRESAL